MAQDRDFMRDFIMYEILEEEEEEQERRREEERELIRGKNGIVGGRSLDKE